MSQPKEKKSIGPAPLLLPQPIVIVGTYDENDRPNGMALSWGGIGGSEPASLCLAVRPSRWTHRAILRRKAFTVGLAPAGLAAAVDYLGLVSGQKEDKISQAGLTPIKSQVVDAPYFAECPLIMECELTQTVDMKSHTLVIGTVLDVKADEAVLDESGRHPDLTKMAPMVYDSAMSRYFGLGQYIGQGFSMGQSVKAAK